MIPAESFFSLARSIPARNRPYDFSGVGFLYTPTAGPTEAGDESAEKHLPGMEKHWPNPVDEVEEYEG